MKASLPIADLAVSVHRSQTPAQSPSERLSNTCSAVTWADCASCGCAVTSTVGRSVDEAALSSDLLEQATAALRTSGTAMASARPRNVRVTQMLQRGPVRAGA